MASHTTKPLPGKARHPRSRYERALLSSLAEHIDSALAIADSDTAQDVDATVTSARSARLRKPMPLMASNDITDGEITPRLFYAPTPAVGVGLKGRDAPVMGAGLPPSDVDALRHYSVRQLSDYARSELLGEMSDYLPAPGHKASASRERFNQLLARIQQHTLARTINNELRARAADASWNWDPQRFHLAPVTGRSHRVVDTGSWAEFIREGGDPGKEGLTLGIFNDVLAERNNMPMAAR